MARSLILFPSLYISHLKWVLVMLQVFDFRTVKISAEGSGGYERRVSHEPRRGKGTESKVVNMFSWFGSAAVMKYLHEKLSYGNNYIWFQIEE